MRTSTWPGRAATTSSGPHVLLALIELEPVDESTNARILTALHSGRGLPNAASATDVLERLARDSPDVPFFRGLSPCVREDYVATFEAFDRFIEPAAGDPRVPMVRGLRAEAVTQAQRCLNGLERDQAVVGSAIMPTDFLGPLERRVMERLWRHGPQTVGSVLEALNAAGARKLAYTTVMTILVRLHDKGYVERSATSRTFTYRAAMDEPALAATVGRRELGRLIERFGAASLAGFAADLDKREGALAEQLRRLADEEDA